MLTGSELGAENKEILKKGLKILNIFCSENQLNQIDHFYSLYTKANSLMNLSRIVDANDFVIKHALDSAAGLPFFKGIKTITDIGAGGGFPSIILAILAPSKTFHLIDVVAKKVDYLKDIKDQLKLENVHVFNASQEKVPLKTKMITCRALGSLQKIVDISLQYGYKKTPIVAYKAKIDTIKQEIKQVSVHLKPQIVPLKVPFLEAQRHMVLYKTSR